MRTKALLDALIHVESYALGFSADLRRLQSDLAQTPPPRGFRYFAPPDEHDDEESSKEIEERRAEAIAPSEFLLRPESREKIKQATLGRIDSDSMNLHSGGRHHYRLFDMYNRDERQFRKVLEQAKRAASEASTELDDPAAPPLARDMSKLRLDLQNLGGVVPAPLFHGNQPPQDPRVPELMLELLHPIEEWVNRIRALVVPDPFPVAVESQAGADVESPSTASDAQRTTVAEEPPPASPPVPDGSWKGIPPEQPLLRGWHAILSALAAETHRNAQVAMKRRNKALEGPIRYVRGKPEVFRNQLLAWIRSTVDRVEEDAESRDAAAGARRELEERGGARLPDLKFQLKSRRKGAARPDPRKREPGS